MYAHQATIVRNRLGSIVPGIRISSVTIGSDGKTIIFQFPDEKDCQIFNDQLKHRRDLKLTTTSVGKQEIALKYDADFKETFGITSSPPPLISSSSSFSFVPQHRIAEETKIEEVKLIPTKDELSSEAPAIQQTDLLGGFIGGIMGGFVKLLEMTGEGLKILSTQAEQGDKDAQFAMAEVAASTVGESATDYEKKFAII